MNQSPPPALAVRAAPTFTQPAPGAEPALTAPPPAEPEVRLLLDVAGLLREVTAGTGAKLEPQVFARLWQAPLDLTRPAVVLRSGASSSPGVLVALVSPGARLDVTADSELEAVGLKLLEGGKCALADSPQVSQSLLCGGREHAIGYQAAGLAALQQPLAGSLSRGSMRLGRALAAGLYEWRKQVPRQIDPLLPAGSELDQAPALRLALHELGYELTSRLVDGYEALGDLSLSMAPAGAGKLMMTASVEPPASSIAGRAVASAKPARVPAAFWELSERTDSAFVFDGSLLSPFLEPSERALALLGEARTSSAFADGLVALTSACLEPGRGVVLAYGRQQRSEEPAKTGAPELKPLPAPAPPAPARYSLLGVEDAKGGCARALAALLDAHERATGAVVQPAERHVTRLATTKALPASVRVLQLGSGQSASYLSMGSQHGALWLGSSSDLALLERTFGELLGPAAKRRSLRLRSELTNLGKAPALVSGFVREDSLPFASVQERRTPTSDGTTIDDTPRVPFGIARDGASLRLSGEVETRAVRRIFAKALSDAWGNAELTKLEPPLLDAALTVMEASCRLGESNACNLLGVVYGDGRGVTKALERALGFLELGCKGESGMACANLAFYKKPDQAEELALFRKSCQLGTAFGCAWWGVRLLDVDQPEAQRRGFEKLALGCDGHVAFACARIGSHYLQGMGLGQDETKAADFNDRACRLGLGVGCVEVASALASGRGRPRDEKVALAYLQKSCKLDKGAGCYALAFAYLDGTGTGKDPAAAREHFDVACQANHAEACRALAEMASEP